VEIKVVENILSANAAVAAQIRERLEPRNIFTVNIIGSPGCGKTTLLERSLPLLAKPEKVLVLVGDLATTRDAERIGRTGVETVQISTGRGCHIPATLVLKTLSEVDLEGKEFLIIENVGNLVCPAGFDIGENCKIVLISVTEGEDKPIKYPLVFQESELAVVTKTDLIPHLEFDREALRGNIGRVHQGIPIIEVGKGSEQGIREWVEWLQKRKAKK
jgi:hydrogenase nickel incorporation protein HypB